MSLHILHGPNISKYAVFERLSLQCLAVFRFMRVLPCKHYTWTHQRYSKRNFSTLLHQNGLSNPMSPLEMSNAWHRVAVEFVKRKHLNWSWYKQLLLSPLSSTLSPRILDHLETQLLCWTISRHLSEKLPLSGYELSFIQSFVCHEKVTGVIYVGSFNIFSGLLRRHQT